MRMRIRKSPEQHLQCWYTMFLESLGVLFCASAGGMRTSIRTAINMKRAGYRKGVPDMQIFEPRGQYHGMLVELKCESKKLPEDSPQVIWCKNLNQRGYYSVIVPHGLTYRQAQDFLENETRNYLNDMGRRQSSKKQSAYTN